MSSKDMKPTWLDQSEYPFRSNYFQVPAGKLHYVDEGSGKPIVFLHGNPDWSFSYRKLIKAFYSENRCIAPDHIGFGLSEKPVDWSYHPEEQAANLERLLLFLDVTDICLVVNDWGGPIGFDFTFKHPGRVSELVIMNTWMWPLNGYPLFWLFSRLMSGATGRLLTGKFNLFTTLLVWAAVYNKLSFSGTIHYQYRAPYDALSKREASIKLPGYLMDAADWFRELYDNREVIRRKKCVLTWGMNDPAFRPYFLRCWREVLPEAPVHKLRKAGHFPQECASNEVVRILKGHLKKGRID